MRHCNSALLIALFAGSALAQTPTPVVHIPVAVTSATGVLTGLKQESFQLYEDGKEQQIDTLAQDMPKSIGILIDTSRSMTKINAGRQAAASFVANSGAEDQFFLAGFSETPKLIVDFTGSPKEIEAGLATISDGQMHVRKRAGCAMGRRLFWAREDEGSAAPAEGVSRNLRWRRQQLSSLLQGRV